MSIPTIIVSPAGRCSIDFIVLETGGVGNCKGTAVSEGGDGHIVGVAGGAVGAHGNGVQRVGAQSAKEIVGVVERTIPRGVGAVVDQEGCVGGVVVERVVPSDVDIICVCEYYVEVGHSHTRGGVDLACATDEVVQRYVGSGRATSDTTDGVSTIVSVYITSK